MSDLGTVAVGTSAGGLSGFALGTVGVVGLGSAFALPLTIPFALIGGVTFYAFKKLSNDFRTQRKSKSAGYVANDGRPEIHDVWVLRNGDEHCEYMSRAVEAACDYLVIRSGFISDHVVNDRFLGGIKNAVERGTVVYLEWGYRFPGARTNEHAVRATWLLERLYWELPEHARSLLRLTRMPTHIKEIAFDDKEAANGSFNWLSNAGKHRLANREKSVVLESFGHARAILMDAEAAWDEWKYVPRKKPGHHVSRRTK